VEWLPFIGAATSAAAVIGVWLRLRFYRHVVNKAAEQGRPIDPAEVIRAAHLWPLSRPSERPAVDPSPDPGDRQAD
jgi:hypothetical protein